MTSSSFLHGTTILCACRDCRPGRREKLAEVHKEGIAIQKGAHGTKHRVFLTPKDVLSRLAGTIDGSAIRDYVDRIMR
jgi:hypothetical protein